MKENKSKGFTFKVSASQQHNKQAKTRDGVAVAGCSLVPLPGGEWGAEFKFRGSRGDNGMWC